MIPENRHATPYDTKPQVPSPRRPPYRSVLVLLRVGTRGSRLAAALMAVAFGLASQIGNGAVAQAKQTRLYLDAPAVSAERASRAGEVANGYSTPNSPASREVLAWLEVPVRPEDVSPPPGGATKAFASITARDGGGAGGVTPDEALAAGEVMLAQLEGSPSGEDDEDGGEELVSAGAVRPQLGDGEQAAKARGTDGSEARQPGDAGSVPDTSVPPYDASTREAYGPVGEPSGGPGVVIPTPSPAAEETTDEVPAPAPPTELASAPPNAGAIPAPVAGTDEETYGPTGPISDVGQAPTIPTPAGPEDAGDGDEQPYPDGSVPASEPEPVPDAAEGEPVGSGPTAENTGPTSDEGADLALVPVPSPTDERPATAEDDSERAEGRAPVAPSNDGGGSETAHAEPLQLAEAETAYAEPPPPAEEASENSAQPNAPEAASTEVPVPEADEERVEIVIAGGETPAETSPEDEAPPEVIPPAEAPLGRKGAGEDAFPYGDTQWGIEQEQTPVDEPSGDDTQWGRPSEEDQPDGREPAGDGPPVEEPPYDVSFGGRPVDESPEVEPPEMVLPPEGPPFADEEASPEPAPGALLQDDASEALPEGQQPGVDHRPEDPEYATSAPPGDWGAAQDSRVRGQEGEQLGRDLQQYGPRGVQNRLPEADPVGPVEEQIGGNDGMGGAVVPGDARIFFSQAAENAGAIQQEQAVVIEGGEASDGMDVGVPKPPAVPDAQTSVPEPLPEVAPRTIEEPVAAEPVPQVAVTPARATAEEPATGQYDEPARRASTRQYDPALQPATVAPASRTDVPTASEPAAAEQAPGQGAASRRPSAEPETEPRTDPKGGKDNR